MLTCTQAYSRLKHQVQGLFDFSVSVCYAMPVFKKHIKELQKDGATTPFPRPDFFYDNSSLEHLRKRTHNYKAKLASYILISSFSFFENYLISALNELIDFHGGSEKFIDLAETRASKFIQSISDETRKHKRKLQEPIKLKNAKKYEKHAKILVNSGYRFPTELLSSYGIRMLIQKTKKMKARDIPEFLQNGLHMNMSEEKVTKFMEFKDRRNKIAHGEKVTLSMRQVMGIHKFLHELAISIDKHLIEHFFVIEKYT
jgi:hypothetical protein